jgi:hypothetical protein
MVALALDCADALHSELLAQASQEGVIYRAIYEAAKAGEPSPSDWFLAGLINRSSYSVQTSIKRLERLGTIEVVRDRRRRVFIVAHGGWRTQVSNAAEMSENDYRRRAMLQAAANEQAPKPIAPREPCFMCGVRGDIGCPHQPWGGAQ